MDYGEKETVVIPQYANSSEKESNELISELYSILYTINAIEKVFIKSVFKSEDEREQYSTTVDGLLVQWNSIIDSLDADVTWRDNNDSEHENNIKQLLSCCVSGDEVASLRFGLRRVKLGINGFEERKRELERTSVREPATAADADSAAAEPGNGPAADSKHLAAATAPAGDTKGKKAIAEATSAFITLMDAIKLNYDSKDTLHPLFSDVLTKSGQISTDFDGRNKLVSWLIRVNKMGIADTLDENVLKEMLWDVDTAYNGFFNQL